MPNVATLDLASKFSAACFRDLQGEVLAEFDSAGKSSFAFAAEFSRAVALYRPVVIIIEDVPYGISSQAMTKPVTRLQGVMMLALWRRIEDVYFLNPSTWQKDYPGVATAPKGTPKSQKDAVRAEAARAHAERLGYTPPDLVGAYIAECEANGTKVLKKHTNPLAKSMTDYVDAFLMTDWTITHLATIRNMTGVQTANI